VQLSKSAEQFVGSDIVQDAEAEDQVERTLQANRSDVSQGAQAEVAPLAEPAHCVLAAVHADISRPRTQRPQHRRPVALATADIEHAANRTVEKVLGGRDDEAELPRHVLSRLHTVARVTIPLVEIAAIIMRQVTVHTRVFHQ
jgi:hypothetical protein